MKVQQLSGDVFKAWFNILCLASKNDGVLPALREIAFRLRLSEDGAKVILSELKKAGLIDDNKAGMRPHNWGKRQYKSDVSTGRVQQFRARHKTKKGNST